MACHPERSEGSAFVHGSIFMLVEREKAGPSTALRYAQDDKLIILLRMRIQFTRDDKSCRCDR
jgi:hypothetical protein